MRKRLSFLRLTTVAVIIIAGILAFTPVFRETTVFWFDMEDVNAGEKVVEHFCVPGAWILMIIAVIRGGLLLARKVVGDVVGIVLGLLNGAYIALLPALMTASVPMGGLAGTRYNLTLPGWIAIGVNGLSILLTLVLCAKEY